MFVPSHIPSRPPRVKFIHAVAFAAILLAMALSGPAQAAFSAFRFTSTNPNDGPSNAGTGFGGVVVCYANGSFDAMDCGPTGFAGSQPWNILLGAAPQSSVTLIAGNPYLTYTIGGAATPSAFADMWITELSAESLDFAGMTVIQQSGSTRTITVRMMDSSNNVLSTTTQDIPSGVPTFVSVTGAGTVDFYRVRASFDGTFAWGANDFLFQVTGSAPALPTVVTGAASGVTASGATLAGTVTAGGASTAVTFDYGLTTAYGTNSAAAESPLAGAAWQAAVGVTLSGLDCATTYHYRATATNSSGTTNGSDGSFTTAVCPNTAPTASSVSLAGSAVYAQSLSGGYTYGDAESDAENTTGGGTSWRVVRSVDNSVATAGDNVAAASGTTGGAAVTYVVATADVGAYLFYCVTPKAAAGIAAGVEACSAAVGPVAKATQAIAFGASPAVVVGGSGNVSATGGASGNAVTFASQTPATCSIAGSTVSGLAPGACTIAADQADNASYFAAPQSLQTFAIGQLAQSIAFGPAPLLAVGGSATLVATGGASGNPVVLTSLTPGFCTVSGRVVTGHLAGTCRIAANQAGGGAYAAAPQATLDLAAFTPPSNMTAAWWNPDESGWGLFVNHQGSTIHAAIFTYAADGEPMWLVGSNVEWQADGTFAGALYRTAGPRLGQFPWTAFQVTPVGEISLAFESGSRATLRYTYREGTAVHAVTKSVRRMDFQTEVPACVSSTGSRAAEWNVQDLWWDPLEPGWGIDLAHQGAVVFATIFTYDTAGRDLWLVASRLERRADGSWFGDLLRTSSPGFDPHHWNGIAWRKVGTLEFHPVDGENGHAIFTVDGVYVEKTVRRMVYGGTVPACR